jgi:hypothetical protein
MLNGFLGRAFLYGSLFLASTALAQEGQLKLEPQSLVASEAQLVELVQQAIRDGGGNPETQSLHLVIATKTGFFKDDPVKAEAAREVATKLVNDLAVAGDKVTLKAFEFGLWEHRTPESSTFTLSSSAVNDPNKISAIADALPKAPKAASRGGHDLERTVVELDQALGSPSDAVLVLLLNSAPSQGAPGEVLVGGNDPAYLSLLERYNRVAGTKEGASLELPYQVILPSGGNTQAKLAAVVFAPKTFSSVSLSGGSRGELLAGSVAPVTPPTNSSGGGFPLWLLLIPVLAAVGFLAFRSLSGGGGAGGKWVLFVDGASPERFPLADVVNGKTIVELCGNNYSSSNGDPTAQLRKAPEGIAVARFVKMAGGVRLEGMNSFEVKELDSDTHSGSANIKTGMTENHDAVLGGNFTNSTNVSKEVNINISFRLSKDGG